MIARVAFLAMLALAVAGCSPGTSGPNCDPSKIAVGMPREEVLLICGTPDHINYSGPYRDGIHEQWVYRRYSPYRRTFLYIDGGKFSSAQWSGE